jgi:DNA-binding transcriptional ArsR family regulator
MRPAERRSLAGADAQDLDHGSLALLVQRRLTPVRRIGALECYGRHRNVLAGVTAAGDYPALDDDDDIRHALTETGALLGDQARANILLALMDGRALTAGELAWHAGVSAQTTSGHLAKLVEAQLVAVVQQGGHRYHRLASREVAEALAALAANGPQRHRPTGPRDEALRAARTCYDHLAGQLGVAIADGLAARGHLDLREADGVGNLSESGAQFLHHTLGIALEPRGGRPLCRICLDWSERRPHLGGRVGAALRERAIALGWITLQPHTRAVTVTEAGRTGFGRALGIVVR